MTKEHKFQSILDDVADFLASIWDFVPVICIMAIIALPLPLLTIHLVDTYLSPSTEFSDRLILLGVVIIALLAGVSTATIRTRIRPMDRGWFAKCLYFIGIIYVWAIGGAFLLLTISSALNSILLIAQ